MPPTSTIPAKTSAVSFHFDDLKGRTLALTGATCGIGRALIPLLASQGLNLILIGRAKVPAGARAGDEPLAEVVARHQNLGVEVRGVACELAIAAERSEAARHIAEIAPTLDGILHVAGMDPRRPVEDTDTDFFRQVMAVNVEPGLDLTRQLLPNIRRSTAGRVLFIGSVTFEIGSSMLSAYVASKGAIIGLTRSLAHELGDEGITVNCIAPGDVLLAEATPELKQVIMNGQALQRHIKPHDLAGLICLLLSNAGAMITGQTINIDGGLVHSFAAKKLQSPRVAK